MLPQIALVVVAREGTDRPAEAARHFRSSAVMTRVPMPPEHLYRPGKGKTLCHLSVDQTWERFPELDGQMSHATCPSCADVLDAEHAR